MGVASLSANASLDKVCENLEGDENFDSVFVAIGNDYKCENPWFQELAKEATIQWYQEKADGLESFEEYDSLAEGLQCTTVVHDNKKAYFSVSVGFGGGNSAQYLFDSEGNIQQLMFIDGLDCFQNIEDQRH